MSHDAIGSWIEKAKASEGSDGDSASAPKGVQVIKRDTQSRGNLIMEIAEKLRPALAKLLDGVTGNNGVLIQPAHIRGYALNIAQKIVSAPDE